MLINKLTDEEILDLRNVISVVTPKYKRLIETVIEERDDLNKKIAEQEMRYQNFVAEAVRGVNARNKALEAAEKALKEIVDLHKITGNEGSYILEISENALSLLSPNFENQVNTNK